MPIHHQYLTLSTFNSISMNLSTSKLISLFLFVTTMSISFLCSSSSSSSGIQASFIQHSKRYYNNCHHPRMLSLVVPTKQRPILNDSSLLRQLSRSRKDYTKLFVMDRHHLSHNSRIYRTFVSRCYSSFPNNNSNSRDNNNNENNENLSSSIGTTTFTQMNDISSTLNTTNTNTTPTRKHRVIKPKNNTTSFHDAKEKRRKFIGQAKAVDRGQYLNVYAPGGVDFQSFEAKSGLPTNYENKLFTVLGIESSCDDTGAAIVRSDGLILGESLASQHQIHEEWGGVVPGLAKTAHEEKIDFVIAEALHNAGLSSVNQVDAIGVTVGPGLEICLRVGCNKAKELAIEYQKPFVGVHHLEAHILMARLPFEHFTSSSLVTSSEKEEEEKDVQKSEWKRAIEFPFLALLVSGGHCQILKCLGIGNYVIMGGTLDDSLGEAFDKTARLLGLPVGGGGGPAVEALAKQGNPTSIPLPIPLQKRQDCNFSYAGLKTAVRLAAEKLVQERNVDSILDLTLEDKANIAASFQNVAVKHVEQRLIRAMNRIEEEQDDEDNNRICSLAVVGGVAANQELRTRLEAICNDRGKGSKPWKLFVPPARLCTDQGSMSAWAAIERIMVGSSDVAETQEVFARYPFQTRDES